LKNWIVTSNKRALCTNNPEILTTRRVTLYFYNGKRSTTKKSSKKGGDIVLDGHTATFSAEGEHALKKHTGAKKSTLHDETHKVPSFKKQHLLLRRNRRRDVLQNLIQRAEQITDKISRCFAKRLYKLGNRIDTSANDLNLLLGKFSHRVDKAAESA